MYRNVKCQSKRHVKIRSRLLPTSDSVFVGQRSLVSLKYRIRLDVLWICSDYKMLLVFGRGIGFIVLVSLLSCVVSLRQYGTPGNTLYVAEDLEPSRGKLQIINRNIENEDSSHLERRKREATTLTTPAIQKNISTWVMVHILIKYDCYFYYFDLLTEPVSFVPVFII